MDLYGGSGLGLTGTDIWAALVEWWALTCAKTRISANDAHIRQPCRKHTLDPAAQREVG